MQYVQVEIGDGLVQRIYRIGGIVFGSEQPALFRSPEGEDHAAFGRGATLECAGDFKQPGNAQRIVIRACAIDAALCGRFTFTIGVPVSAVDYALVRSRCAGELRQYILALNYIALYGERCGKRRSKIDRFEIPAPRRDAQFGQILPGRSEQRFGGFS